MKQCLLALSLLSLWTLAMEGKKFLLVFVLWPRSIRFDLVHDLCRLSQTMRVAPLRGLPVVPGNLSGVQSRSFNTAGVSNYLTKLKASLKEREMVFLQLMQMRVNVVYK